MFEGNNRYTPGEKAPGAVKPVITEKHADGNCSITGGVVVRDPALPALAGRYVYGDFCRGVLQTAVLSAGRARNQTDRKLQVDQLSSFGEDARGRVYVDLARRAGLPASSSDRPASARPTRAR